MTIARFAFAAGAWLALAVALSPAGAQPASEPPRERAEEHAQASGAHAAAVEHGGHDAADHGGGGHSNVDPLSIDIDLAFCTLIVFVLLLVVLRKFAWGPIAKGLDERERTIAEHIAFAEASQEEGRRLLAQYESKLQGAQDEVRAIMEEARRLADQAHQEMMDKARSEATAEIERARHEIATAKDQALIELAQSSANHAVELAGKILGKTLNAGEHRQLIESSLAGFTGDARRN